MAIPEILFNKFSKEYITLEIAAEDRTGAILHLSGYTASFDGGQTFVAGTAVPGHTDWWQWFCAGPLAPDQTGVAAVLAGDGIDILVRVADTPEIPAAKLATVRLT